VAAIAAVVIAIVRSGWRSLRGARSFTGNNLVVFIALLMTGEPGDRPSSTAVMYLMVGLLWALPLSQELTRRIPPIRFRLWPLNSWQKAAVYAINLLVNPLVGIAILFGMLSRDRPVGLGLAAAAVATPFAVLVGQALAGRGFGWSPLAWIPRPPGPLGGLVQSHIRELLQLLDVYLAMLTAIVGILYIRFSANPDPEARIVLGCLVVLLMSTCAQGHVSFDSPALETRLRLLPVSSTAVLLASMAADYCSPDRRLPSAALHSSGVGCPCDRTQNVNAPGHRTEALELRDWQACAARHPPDNRTGRRGLGCLPLWLAFVRRGNCGLCRIAVVVGPQVGSALDAPLFTRRSARLLTADTQGQPGSTEGNFNFGVAAGRSVLPPL